MPPTHVMNAITWGILADARSRYRVRVCHFLFMANHMHMILVVDDPEHISAFMRYVKSEISHAINRLLDRGKKTIWAEGYDSPIILSADKVIHYIKYIYLNPARAGLVNSIKEYPGVSSWRMFSTDHLATSHDKIPRPTLKPLATPALSVNEQQEIVKTWGHMGLKKQKFVLEPWAWLESFSGLEKEEVLDRILSGIRTQEEVYREKREARGKTVLGPTALRRQSMAKEYTPKRRNRRMIVLCDDKDLRRRFIEHFRALCDAARAAYESWKRGDLRSKIPPGMFAPKLPVLASALPV